MELKQVEALLALNGLKLKPIAYLSGEQWIKYNHKEDKKLKANVEGRGYTVRLDNNPEQAAYAYFFDIEEPDQPGISSMAIRRAPEKEEPVEIEEQLKHSHTFSFTMPLEYKKEAMELITEHQSIVLLQLFNNAYILAEPLENYGK